MDRGKREKILEEFERFMQEYDRDIGFTSYDSEVLKGVHAMLKAQEPVEPVFERQFMTSIEIYDCGKCGTSLGAKGIAKYCMECGRAVKWDG